MARFDRIRSLLIPFALAQLGVACCPAEEPVTEADVDLRNALPDVAMLIERCAVDSNNCIPLCNAALTELFGDEAEYYYVVDCTLTVKSGEGGGPFVHLVYDDNSACGRAPVGLLRTEAAETNDPVGAWLAQAAHLESASVVAFAQLAIDLARLGAPRELVSAAIASARDEVEHAALLRTLAAARGITVAPARCAPYRPATLLELALHNAREGCARETLGAAVNAWQAQRATDPAIRAAFARIAPDEAQHAELSWQIDAWASTQLSPDELATVAAARVEATARLASTAGGAPAAARVALGLPAPDELCRLARTLALGCEDLGAAA